MSSDTLSFPLADLLPKKETQAQSFLSKNPQFDGRGVRIAIFDTGVDAGAAGLQVTSDGRAKLIGLYDASGDGDVDTSTVVRMDPETRIVTGLSGRKMRIPDFWSDPPDGQFHTGLVSAFHLYPKRERLADRMTKQMRDKEFSPSHTKALTAAAQALSDWNLSHKDPADPLTPEQRLQKEELEQAVELLTSYSQCTDFGPTFDVLVWSDGQQYNATIDSERDLERATILQSYSECQRFATLSPSDRLNYAVNVHNEGNLLEVVSLSGSHGTHVACIAAANFPEEPERNGVAPGAQVISIGIGAQTQSSMETTNALTRAVITCSKLGVDIINMSFGEFAHWTGGRVMDHLADLVNKSGILFCVSAGNNGPALSTIGTPPMSTTNAFIGIGAFVTPDMMLAEYSMREKLPARSFTWTSRGPTTSGDMGVSVCAPGAAITSVPNYGLTGSRLMNGTSMSAPNAAGCLALILSGLKQQGIPYSNFSVRRAIQNTALKVPDYDPLSMGHGLIQVDAAFEHLKQHQHLVEQDVRFQVLVDGVSQGVYHRIAKSDATAFCPKVHSLTLEPKFLKDEDRDNSDKIAFNLNLVMTCDAAWVQSPHLLSLSYTCRNFSVRVDPTGLGHGVHFALIHAFDSTNVQKGPVFSIPVTVIVAEDCPTDGSKYSTLKDQVLKSGQTMRQFLQPPLGSTSAEIRVKNKSGDETSLFLHTMQLLKQRYCRQQEKQYFFNLSPGAESVHWIPVSDHTVLEVTVSKWWSSLLDSRLEVEVTFSGLGVRGADSQSVISMTHSQGIKRLDMHSSLGFEEVQPVLQLDRVSQAIRPSDHKITPLSSIYLLPEDRQLYENTLTYSFTQSRPAEVLVKSPLLHNYLYESPLNSTVAFVYDANKRLVSAIDYKPKFVKLEKGEYTIILHARHESVKSLERLNEVPLVLTSKLPASISLDCFSHEREALIDGKKFQSKVLSPGKLVPLFLTSIPSSKVPKGVTLAPGMRLTGSLTLSKDDKKKKADDVRFEYLVDVDLSPSTGQKSGGKEEKSEKSKPTDGKDESDERRKFEDAVTDLQVQWIGRSQDSILRRELVSEVREKAGRQQEEEKKWELDLKLTSSHMQSLLQATTAEKESEKSGKDHQSDHTNVVEIVSLADEVLNRTDLTSLLGRLESAKVESASPDSVKRLEKEKALIIEILCRKGLAIMDLIDRSTSRSEESDSSPSTTNGQFEQLAISGSFEAKDVDQVYVQLSKLTKGDLMSEAVNNKLVAQFLERHAVLRQEIARAIRLLQKVAAESKVSASHLETERKIMALIKNKRPDWIHIHDFIERGLDARFPHSYRIL